MNSLRRNVLFAVFAVAVCLSSCDPTIGPDPTPTPVPQIPNLAGWWLAEDVVVEMQDGDSTIEVTLDVLLIVESTSYEFLMFTAADGMLFVGSRGTYTQSSDAIVATPSALYDAQDVEFRWTEGGDQVTLPVSAVTTGSFTITIPTEGDSVSVQVVKIDAGVVPEELEGSWEYDGGSPYIRVDVFPDGEYTWDHDEGDFWGVVAGSWVAIDGRLLLSTVDSDSLNLGDGAADADYYTLNAYDYDDSDGEVFTLWAGESVFPFWRYIEPV